MSRKIVSGSALCLARAWGWHGLCCGEHGARAREAGQNKGGGPYGSRAWHIYDYRQSLGQIKIVEETKQGQLFAAIGTRSNECT